VLSESTPVLSHAIIKFEEFMMAWEDLRRRHVVLKAWTDMGLKWAKKYYRQMDDTDAYVLTMCKSSSIDYLQL